MLEVNAKAPSIPVPDQTGAPRAIDEFRGRWVVLWFYPKDHTSGWTSEASQFRDAQPEFAKAGAQIVGVSRDSVASHESFAREQRLPFPILADTDEALCEAYGTLYERVAEDGSKSMALQRSTFLIDPGGVVRHVWPKVSVAGHAVDVLSVLHALIAGKEPDGT